MGRCQGHLTGLSGRETGGSLQGQTQQARVPGGNAGNAWTQRSEPRTRPLGDAAQLRAEDWGAAGGLRGSAAPRNGRQKSRPPPRPEEVWEMHARREGEGGRGEGDTGARAEVAIPAQLHGTVTGPEDPQSRASGALGRITGSGSSGVWRPGGGDLLADLGPGS